MIKVGLGVKVWQVGILSWVSSMRRDLRSCILSWDKLETKKADLSSNNSSLRQDMQLDTLLSWYIRPNPEDWISRKPDDQKNDKTTEK